MHFWNNLHHARSVKRLENQIMYLRTGKHNGLIEKINNKMSERKVLVPNIANHSSILIDVAGMFLKFAFIKFRFLVDRNNKYTTRFW
jgi:hypothetical protein